MTRRYSPNSPEWHKSWSYGYLASAVLLAANFLVVSMPTTPLLLKAFAPYPALADAHHWQGTVHVEGKLTFGLRGRLNLPRYFIDTPQGRKEFHCGSFGGRYTCNSHLDLEGAAGEVWYHPLFGTLQKRFIPKTGRDAGKLYEMSYQVGLEMHRERSRDDSSLGPFAIPVFFLASAVFCWLRYRKHRAAFLA